MILSLSPRTCSHSTWKVCPLTAMLPKQCDDQYYQDHILLRSESYGNRALHLIDKAMPQIPWNPSSNGREYDYQVYNTLLAMTGLSSRVRYHKLW
jgi:hypothetical protein